MKIVIKKIHLKNFFSIGNKWLSVDFREGLYRVTGENLDNNTKNGSGKSSVFCDGLLYGLFGKPLRKINVTDIPNVINNKKNCEVKLEFSVETKNYLIHRGINPSFLKLYENYKEGDETSNNYEQDSAKKYTQKRIDELIGANYNTYSHLLIMSNSYAVPFLDLDTIKKREIVEDILGISIFGTMLELIKKDHIEIKNNYILTTKEHELVSSNIKHMEDMQNKLKLKAKEFDVIKAKKIDEYKQDFLKIKDKLTKTNTKLINEKEYINKTDILNKQINEYIKLDKEVSTNISLNKNSIKEKSVHIKKLKEHPVCPLCNTETKSQHIVEFLTSMENEVSEKQKINIELEKKEKEIIDELNKLKKDLSFITDILNKQQYILSEIKNLEKEKEQIKEQILEIKKEKNNFLELINESELETKKKELVNIECKLTEFSKEKEYVEFIKQLFSDNGIKNYIIKKVVSFWNNKVNFYLNKLNTNFNIQFDENLEALIKSRNRDPLEYHSFSGGEKARIDVAILLSILDISKLQNSIDLNVMVIDELLDGGLDDVGREDVLSLFKEMSVKQGKSIYVISHNNNIPLDLFKKEITLYKEDGFTHL